MSDNDLYKYGWTGWKDKYGKYHDNIYDRNAANEYYDQQKQQLEELKRQQDAANSQKNNNSNNNNIRYAYI